MNDIFEVDSEGNVLEVLNSDKIQRTSQFSNYSSNTSEDMDYIDTEIIEVDIDDDDDETIMNLAEENYINIDSEEDNTTQENAGIEINKSILYLFYNNKNRVINDMLKLREEVLTDFKKKTELLKVANNWTKVILENRSYVNKIVYYLHAYSYSSNDIVNIIKNLILAQQQLQYAGANEILEQLTKIEKQVNILVPIVIANYRKSNMEKELTQWDELLLLLTDPLLIQLPSEDGLIIKNDERIQLIDFAKERFKKYCKLKSYQKDSSLLKSQQLDINIPFVLPDVYNSFCDLYTSVVDIDRVISLMNSSNKEQAEISKRPASIKRDKELRDAMRKPYQALRLYFDIGDGNEMPYQNITFAKYNVIEYINYIFSRRELPKFNNVNINNIKLIDFIEEKNDSSKRLLCKCSCGTAVDVTDYLLEVETFNDINKVIETQTETDYANASMNAKKLLNIDISMSNSCSRYAHLIDKKNNKGIIYHKIRRCPNCKKIHMHTLHNLMILSEHAKSFLKSVASEFNNPRTTYGIISVDEMNRLENQQIVGNNTLTFDIGNIYEEESLKSKVDHEFNINSNTNEILDLSKKFLLLLEAETLMYASETETNITVNNPIGNVCNLDLDSRLYNNFLYWFLKNNYKELFTAERLLTIAIRYLYGDVINQYTEIYYKNEDSLKRYMNNLKIYSKYLESCGYLSEDGVIADDIQDTIISMDSETKEIYINRILAIIIKSFTICYDSNCYEKEEIQSQISKIISTENDDILQSISNNSLFDIINDMNIESFIENEIVVFEQLENYLEDKISLCIDKAFEKLLAKDKPEYPKLDKYPELKLSKNVANLLEPINSEVLSRIFIELGKTEINQYGNKDKMELVNKFSEVQSIIQMNLDSFVDEMQEDKQSYIDYQLRKIVIPENLLEYATLEDIQYTVTHLDFIEKESAQSLNDNILSEISYRIRLELRDKIMYDSYELGIKRVQQYVLNNFESIFLGISSVCSMDLSKQTCFARYYYKELNKMGEITNSDLNYKKVCNTLNISPVIKKVLSSINRIPRDKLNDSPLKLDLGENKNYLIEGDAEIEIAKLNIWKLIKIIDMHQIKKMTEEIDASNITQVEDLVVGNELAENLMVALKQQYEGEKLKTVEYTLPELFSMIYKIPANELNNSLMEDIMNVKLLNCKPSVIEILRYEKSFLKTDEYSLFEKLCGERKFTKSNIMLNSGKLLAKKIRKYSGAGTNLNYKIDKSLL